MVSVDIKARAKINLHLAIGNLRDDGFHDLQSIFARLELADILHVSAKKSSFFNVKVKGLEQLSIKGEDTLSKAARLWSECVGFDIDVVIEIEKNIPSEAGLGGGSSDGASVLLALQQIFKNDALNFDSLLKIGASIGSDVPFFLYDCKFAYVRGRGEIVERIDSNFDFDVLLMKPKQGVSTKGAFKALDQIERQPFFSKKLVLDSFNKGFKDWNNLFYNDFELVIDNPILEKIQKDSKLFVHMSGSGSTIFCICEKNNMDIIDEIKEQFKFLSFLNKTKLM